MMYVDFESILKPIQGPNPEPTGSYTSEVTKHRDSKMQVLVQTTTFLPLLWCANAVDGN